MRVGRASGGAGGGEGCPGLQAWKAHHFSRWEGKEGAETRTCWVWVLSYRREGSCEEGRTPKAQHCRRASLSCPDDSGWGRVAGTGQWVFGPLPSCPYSTSFPCGCPSPGCRLVRVPPAVPSTPQGQKAGCQGWPGVCSLQRGHGQRLLRASTQSWLSSVLNAELASCCLQTGPAPSEWGASMGRDPPCLLSLN